MRAIRGLVSATVLTAGCLCLAGCLGIPASVGPIGAAPEPPKLAAADKQVDDATKHILQAAGLDPSDPSQPKEIGRNVAGVVQVHYQGRNYGTALAKPLPGKIQFTDPNVVAAMLAGPGGRAKLAAAFKGPLVDVDSRDCRQNQKRDRRARKAFRIRRVCPSPSGTIWADLNRREMVVELKMAAEYASLVQPPNTQMATNETAQDPEIAKPATTAAVNLLSGKSEPIAQAVDTSLPAAAPISLKAPVRSGAASELTETTAPANSPSTSPWGALLAPTRTAEQAPQPEAPAQAIATATAAPPPPRQKVVLAPLPAAPEVETRPATEQISPPPQTAVLPAPPNQVVTVSSAPAPTPRGEPPPPLLAVSTYSSAPSALAGPGAALQPRLFSSSNPVREVDGAYNDGSSSNVAVISGAYQPRSSSSFR